MNRDEERTIEQECQRILTRFCLYNDRKQSEKLADLFTSDGTWLRLGEILKGRENIRKAMEKRPAEAEHRHILSNVLVTVIDADHANVSSYKSIYYDDARVNKTQPVPLNGPKWVSVYSDSLVRTDEGWRIARMDGITLFERDPIR